MSDDELKITPVEPVRHRRRPNFPPPRPPVYVTGLPDPSLPIVSAPTFCRTCARYSNEAREVDDRGAPKICPACKAEGPAPEQLVTVEGNVPERMKLKMRIAQNVRDLDEQGLRTVLAAIAAERTRQGLDSK